MEKSKIAAIAVAVLVLLGGGVFIATREDNKNMDNSDMNNSFSSEPADNTSMQEDSKSIVEIASGDSQFSTLVAAVKANIEANNGVIHVIDTVVLPQS